MQTGKTYIKAISINAFRQNSKLNGEVVGLAYVTPKGRVERLCYKVKYDSFIDYIPVTDVEAGAYQITSESEAE